MEKRDLILRMIQQTAHLLRAVFNSFPLDTTEAEHTFQDLTTSLKENNNLDIDSFIACSDDEALEQLRTMDGMDLANIELLADILYHFATPDNEKSILLNQKALLLFNYVAKTSSTYDAARQAKVNQVKLQLT